MLVVAKACTTLAETFKLTHPLVQLVPYVVLLEHALHRLEIIQLGSWLKLRLTHMSNHFVDVEKFGPLGHWLDC